MACNLIRDGQAASPDPCGRRRGGAGWKQEGLALHPFILGACHRLLRKLCQSLESVTASYCSGAGAHVTLLYHFSGAERMANVMAYYM